MATPLGDPPQVGAGVGTPCHLARFGSESAVSRGARSHDRRHRMIDQPARKSSRVRSPSLDEARLRQQAIGVKLRQMFDQVVNEPVPDEFLQILRRADGRRAGDG